MEFYKYLRVDIIVCIHKLGILLTWRGLYLKTLPIEAVKSWKKHSSRLETFIRFSSTKKTLSLSTWLLYHISSHHINSQTCDGNRCHGSKDVNAEYEGGKSLRAYIYIYIHGVGTVRLIRHRLFSPSLMVKSFLNIDPWLLHGSSSYRKKTRGAHFSTAI